MKIYQKGKRILAALLGVLLLFGSPGQPIEAAALDAAIWTDGLLQYRQIDGMSAVTVTGSDQALSGDLVIPEYFSDMEVVRIEDGAFEGQTGLTSVTVPDTVQRIGARAFYGCSALEQADVENTLQYVGEEAFAETAWYTAHAQDELMILDGVVLISAGENVSELALPETVRVIASQACMDHTALTSVVMTACTGYVGARSFSGCTNLSDVILPNGVKDVGDYAFAECAVTRIVIPATVLSVGAGAFVNCTFLEQVILWDGVVRIGSNAFLGCSAVEQLSIPDSVTQLGSGVFRKCSNLQKVVAGSRIAAIPDYAFQECTSLSSVTIRGAVTRIGIGAFNKCTSLQAIALPDSLMDIDAEAFQSCMSLTEVNIPASLRSVGVNAFFDTALVKRLQTEQAGSSYVIWDGQVLLSYRGEDEKAVIPEGVTLVAGAAFAANETICEIVLPEGLRSLSAYAFDALDTLEQIYIPDSVSHIGAYAFWDCISLREIILPASLTCINEGVLFGCEQLVYAEIPQGVEQILNEAFRYTALSDVTLPESVTYVGDSAFYDIAALGEIVVNNPLCELDECAVPENTVIRGYEGSAAEEYARINGNPFLYLEELTVTTTTALTTAKSQMTTSAMTQTGEETTAATTRITTTTPHWTTTTTATSTTADEQAGDLNGDGEISVSDVTAVMTLYVRYAAGLLTEEERVQLSLADVNRDGIVDLSDATLLLSYYAVRGAGLTDLPFAVWRDVQETGG
ncbi:MAG: leucine-rich repeat protein [Ruminococcus sp.]|nr:leucine-rich repeat protein [Ruminococcus sp.]